MRRIYIHLKDFVLHSEFRKVIQRRFESQKEKKRNEKNLNLLKYFVLHSESQKAIRRRFESKKRKKRNEKNLYPPEGFCIPFRIPKGNSKKV